jgi:hypothetical protein
MPEMHDHHEVFISGIENRQKVVLTFASKEDGGQHLIRTCAPMDYGPSRNAGNKSDRYHFWDYDSDSPGGRHTLSLLPEQIVAIDESDESFDPAEFVTWEPQWFYPRDWGEFS